MLSCKYITKEFDGFEALKDVSTKIIPGEITAVIGPSGGGKTTFFNAISLADPPSKGHIKIDEDIYEFPSTKKLLPNPWPKVTMVFQQLFLWPHMTLKENCITPARLLGIPGIYDTYNELKEYFSLTDLTMNRYPNQASLGEKQRCSVIRALLVKPKYLLLDEITSAMDVEQIKKLADLLISKKKEKLGIGIITHLLGFAENTADSVAFIEGGKILWHDNIEGFSHPDHERVAHFLDLMNLKKR